ncbi:hypothetical protein DY000_02022142, partial [Brassica cretica]
MQEMISIMKNVKNCGTLGFRFFGSTKNSLNKSVRVLMKQRDRLEYLQRMFTDMVGVASVSFDYNNNPRVAKHHVSTSQGVVLLCVRVATVLEYFVFIQTTMELPLGFDQLIRTEYRSSLRMKDKYKAFDKEHLNRDARGHTKQKKREAEYPREDFSASKDDIAISEKKTKAGEV